MRHALPAGANVFRAARNFVNPHHMLPGYGHKAPQFFVSNDTLLIDLSRPGGQAEKAVRVSIPAADAANLLSFQRHLHRAGNHKDTRRVIAGMVLLLALCGWIADGEDGARLALSCGVSPPEGPAISPDTMLRQFGARQLHPTEMPALFAMLHDICRRAHLPRMPDLYYLSDPNSMNAYALGGPERSAITVTEGLLRGMTPAEIAGILAHEVAHIRNNDVTSMSWATALHRAIVLTSFAALQARSKPGAGKGPSITIMLTGASVISHLLYLTLSRIRELDADAAALELIDNPGSLVAALHKLEHHHGGSHVPPPASEGPARFLRSHPPTWERVGILAKLSH